MARRTYSNAVNEVETSIAIERLLVATFPQTWTPSRISLDALPTGFVDLGSVVEDTPSFKVSRSKYQLVTGIPQVLQYQAVQGLSGSFTVALNSNSWRKAQYAFGNYTAVSSATAVTTVSSIVNGSQIQVSTMSTSFVIGQQVIIATAANFDKADAVETRITSINTITGGNITLYLSPPSSLMAVNQNIGTYAFQTHPIGGRNIKFYTLLGVADFIDGVQIVHEMMKVAPGADFEEAPRPSEAGRIPLMFDMIGTEQDVAGCTELLIARRHYFPTANNAC